MTQRSWIDGGQIDAQFVDPNYLASLAGVALPATLPGLQGWYAPDSLQSGAQWSDKSPNGNSLTQATGNRQGSLASLLGVVGLQTGVQGGTARFMSGTIGSQDCNGSSLYVLMAPIALGNSSGTRDMLAVNAGSAMEWFESGGLGSGNCTPVLDYPTPSIQSLAAIYTNTPALWSYTGSANGRALYIDGMNTTNGASGGYGAYSAGGVNGSNNLFTSIVLGIDFQHVDDTYAGPAIFVEVVSYNQPHTTQTRKAVEAYFAGKYNGCQFVFDGNSQVKGDHATGQGTAITGRVKSLIPASLVLGVNTGTNGQTTPQLTARFTTTVLPLLNAYCRRVILGFWELENDVNNNGASGNPSDTSYAPTAWANCIAYSRMARQFSPAQTKIGILTCLPNGNVAAPANYEACRLAANALVRANYGATDSLTGLPYFDWIADVGATSTAIGNASAVSNRTYYDTDSQHLVDGGVLVAAQMVATAISGLVHA